jgi:hypothetical protein
MYSDKYGQFFGRLDERGNVTVLHVEDGLPATRLDASVYPVIADATDDGELANWRSSSLSARYEFPEGIVLSRADADKLGIEIE